MARKNTVWVVVVSVGIIAAALSARLPGSTAAAPPPGINHQVDDYPLSPTGGLITIARPEGATGNDVDAEWERRIATHVIVLRHTGLYAKVLQNESSELRKTKVFKDFNGDADGMLEWLRRNLSVRAIPGTTLIEVSVRPGEYDSDARAIVKDIVSQHINDGSERVFLEGQQASQTLKQLQLRYRLDSQETEARLLKRWHRIST